MRVPTQTDEITNSTLIRKKSTEMLLPYQWQPQSI